jgi:hypothetical protein
MQETPFYLYPVDVTVNTGTRSNPHDTELSPTGYMVEDLGRRRKYVGNAMHHKAMETTR